MMEIFPMKFVEEDIFSKNDIDISSENFPEENKF